jgi:hypothetical protein
MRKSQILQLLFFLLILDNELIYVGQKKDLKKRVVTELEENKDILNQYHSNPMGGHSGINNTLAKISQYYTWHGMKADVTEYVSHKNICIWYLLQA